MSTRSRTSFGFLEQILEEEETNHDQFRDPNACSELDSTDKTDNERLPKNKKGNTRNKTNSEPSVVYPVQFNTSRNKSCQTRLSTFPMFPVNDLEATVWISGGEGRTQKQNKLTSKVFVRKKTSKSNKYEQKKDQDENLKSRILATKNEDGSRKEFNTEHQLKRSKNPVLLAWLHQKNRLLKKKKRAERREKREKRTALQEERRLREARIVESEKKVKEWMLMKRRQLAKTFSLRLRTARAFEKSRICPDEGNEEPEETRIPEKRVPSNYRVVRSFKYQAYDANDMSNSKFNVEEKSCRKHNEITSDIDQTGKGNDTSVRTKQKLVSSKSQRFQKQELEDSGKAERPKTAVMRPKTAPTGGKNCSPITTPKMQSMTYDEWLKHKRKEDKKKQVEQVRETMDSHFERVISDLGKERVRKIREGKKHIDTGLKNFDRTPEQTSAKSPKSNSSPYKLPRPKSAWPTIGESSNGNIPKEMKKLGRQMDKLDLNEKNSKEVVEKSNNPEMESATTSTVREDYFDYGSEVETPSSRRNGFVNNHSPSQSLDFQIM